MRVEKLDVVDLFSGAGGLSWGLEAAGFSCVAAVENDEDSCTTYRSAFPGVKLFDHPDGVERVDFEQFKGVALIAGGPPCQPFSSGGKRLGRGDDRDMIPEFTRAIREAEPEAFLMENVPGLVTGKRRDYFDRITAELAGLGYALTWEVVNAAEYGVPQKRRRLFVVGVRDGKFRFPAPTHGPRAGRPYVVAGDVLDPSTILGEPNPSKVVYAKNPDLRPSPYHGHVFNGGGRAINLDEPSHTILAAAGGNKTHFLDTEGEVPRYHAHLMNGGEPRQGTLPGARRITVEESARLQTFPSRVEFAGSRSSQYTQVGNAVPPRLAAVIGVALRLHLLGHGEAMVNECIDEAVDLLDVGLVAI